MFNAEHAFFIKKTEENRFFTEFLKEGGCFFLLEIRNTLTKDESQVREELQLLLKEIKEEITAKNIAGLYDFEEILDKKIEKIEKVEETDAFSLTAGLLVDNILYLTARGNGKIYLKRGDVFELIISSDSSASGICQNNDLFIFTSDRFFSFFDKEKINKQSFNRAPKEIVDELLSQTNSEKYVELSALLLLFKNMETVSSQKPAFSEIDKKTEFSQVEKTAFEPASVSNQSKLIKEETSENELIKRKFIPKSKLFILLIVIVLFLILLWSVVFGQKRRVQASLLKKVKTYQEKIESSLVEAADSSFLDYDKSFNFLSSAKKDLDELKKIVGKTKFQEIKDLEQKISSTEKQLIKKEEKKYEEFYDLKLIEKGAQASKMFFDGDLVALLNANDGEIYVLSMVKKSTKTYKKDEIRGAALIALYNKEIFFFKKEGGIYKFDKNGELSLTIPNDKDWGEIIDLWVYNSNIYLLDSGKDEIYKYLVAEKGYSAKTSYFKKGYTHRKLNNARSMAIDLSVYFAVGDNLYKYTSGIPIDFKIKLPVEKKSYNFDKVFTNKNCQKLYLLDKDKGKIFIFNKSGEYEKQIDSDIFAKADDFIALEGENSGVYVLVKDKIYKTILD